MRTVLPANWVAAGYGVPQVCSRHGEPAVREPVGLQSRPPGWSYGLLLLGALPFLIVLLATRKTVAAPSWPFCARCKALRIRLLVIGPLAAVGGCAVTVVGAGVAGGHGQGRVIGAPLIVLGVLVMVTGVVGAVLSGSGPLARAQVTRDGAWVEVLKPERRFAEQAAAFLQQAGVMPGAGQQVRAPQFYAPYPIQPNGQPVYPPQPYQAQPYGYQPYPSHSPPPPPSPYPPDPGSASRNPIAPPR